MDQYQKEDYLKRTGQVISRLREEKGLTQEELAKLCNVQPAMISKIEAGQINVLITSLLGIARALKVDVRELVVNY